MNYEEAKQGLETVKTLVATIAAEQTKLTQHRQSMQKMLPCPVGDFDKAAEEEDRIMRDYRGLLMVALAMQSHLAKVTFRDV